MYLRKNKNSKSRGGAVYLSIAHNVWLPGKDNKKGQSRPTVITTLGNESSIDIDLARDIVSAIKKIMPQFYSGRGKDKYPAIHAAKEIRKIEPFLKALVSRELHLSNCLPSGSDRAEILESFIREKISDANAITGYTIDQDSIDSSKAEILNSTRAWFGIESTGVGSDQGRNPNNPTDQWIPAVDVNVTTTNQEIVMLTSKEKARKLLNSLYYSPQVPSALYELLALLVSELPDYK